MSTPRHPVPLGARLRAFVSLALAALCLAPAARADASAMDEVGINTHIFRYGDYETAADEIIASGVKWVRIGMEWDEIQDKAGEPDLMVKADKIAMIDIVVNKFHAAGVGMVWQLHYSTDWCTAAPEGATDGIRFYRPSDWLAWRKFVRYMTRRYSDRVHHWEVWNEPDSSNFFKVLPGETPAAQYKILLEVASSEIRAASSENKVILGGLAGHNGSEVSYGIGTFLDQLLAIPGVGGLIDIVSYHPYSDAVGQRAFYDGMWAVLAKHNLHSMPIWLTETGYSTKAIVANEPHKADRIAQNWINSMGFNNIERIFWYLDRNVILPNHPSITQERRDSEQNFGLRANDRTPLMPWFHYQALNGGLVDFRLQTAFPALAATQRSVTYLSPADGNGSQVTNHVPDGSSKRIALGTYLYFQINDQWIHNTNGGLDDSVEVTVSVLNNAPLLPTGAPGTSGFLIQYDGRDGAYMQSEIKYRTSGGGYDEHTFTLPNIFFTNRQNHGADFRLFAGSTADLVVNSVVVRRRSDSARIRLGATDRFHLMDRVHRDDPAALNHNPATTFDGEACRQIPLGKHMFFRVSDAWVRTGDTRVRLKIRFWDDGVPGPDSAPRNLVVEYNALGGLTAKAVGIRKSATPGWREATLTLEDADFRNAGSFEQNDFRIRTGGNGPVAEYIGRVEVIPLTLLPADDFEDGDSAGWTTVGNTWSVLTETGGNRVLHQSQTSSGETIAFTGQSTWNDYDFSADLKIHHASAAGLVARYTDVNNYYVFAISTGQNRIYLKKRVAGVTSSLVDIPWTGPGAPFAADTAYRLRLVLNGPRITAFVEDTQVADLYDTSLSTGRAGVRAVNARYSADNVEVR